MVAVGNALVRIAAVAGVILLLISLFASRPAQKIGYFSTGPQVPIVGSIEVNPPDLTIPGSPLWDEEDRRALVLIDATPESYSIEVRTSYDPVEGQARVSTLTGDAKIPWPAGADAPGRWPGFLFCAAPDADGGDVFLKVGAFLRFGGPARPYLAGRMPDGSIGGVPILTDSVLIEELQRMGSAVTPGDLTRGFESSEGLIEIRITQKGADITYRWGHMRGTGNDEPRWAGGAVTLDAGKVRRGEGLTGLVDYMEQRFVVDSGPGALVSLQIGTGVTYEQVLRAVECGKGSPEVAFFYLHWCLQHELEDLILPEPSIVQHDSPLVDDSAPGHLRTIVNLLRDGTMKVKGMDHSTASLAEYLRRHPVEGLLIRADLKARYGDWKEVVHIARKLDLKIELGFKAADPQIPEEQSLALAPVDLSKKPDILLMTDDTPVQEVYDEILDLLRRGSSGIRFP